MSSGNPLREFEDALITQRVASRVIESIEFPSEDAYRDYMRKHPKADPNEHEVVLDFKPPAPPKPDRPTPPPAFPKPTKPKKPHQPHKPPKLNPPPKGYKPPTPYKEPKLPKPYEPPAWLGKEPKEPKEKKRGFASKGFLTIRFS
jgi:hypothetical protein